MGAAGALLLAVGYGADYSKRRNVLVLQGYVGLSVVFTLWLICVRYLGLPAARWPFVGAAVVTGGAFLALAHQNSFTLEKLRSSSSLRRAPRRWCVGCLLALRSSHRPSRCSGAKLTSSNSCSASV